MAWTVSEDADDGGVDLSTLAAMSEYSSTSGGSQRWWPGVLLPPTELAAMHVVSDDGEEPRDEDDDRAPSVSDSRVSEIMTRAVAAIAPNASMARVGELFTELALHQLPVTDGGRLVGVISSNDLLRLRIEPLRRSRRNGRLQARHLMQTAPVTVRENATVREAALTLCEGALHALPVVDADQRLVGMVASTDLIRLLAQR